MYLQLDLRGAEPGSPAPVRPVPDPDSVVPLVSTMPINEAQSGPSDKRARTPGLPSAPGPRADKEAGAARVAPA
ncbi:hypothetical protein GCM10010518_24480 [Kitasatospora cinereorecta]